MTILDLSTYQGFVSVDTFRGLRAVGITRVILKAGGSNFGTYTDRVYRQNAANGAAAGMPLGHYWFNGYGSPDADAAFFVRNLTAFRPGDVLVLDIETFSATTGLWGPGQLLRFAQLVHGDTGVVPWAYMSSSVTRAADWSSCVAYGIPLWVAAYFNNPPAVAFWPHWAAWQYTSSGSVPGIGGNVDLSHEGVYAATTPVAAAPPIIKPKETDMSAVIIPIAGSTEVDLFSTEYGTFVHVTAPSHLSILSRYLKNDGTDHMLRAETDICAAYLRALVPPEPATPGVDVNALAEAIATRIPALDANAIAAAIKLPQIDLNISGKAVSA